MSSRRQFVASAFALLSAGCLAESPGDATRTTNGTGTTTRTTTESPASSTSRTEQRESTSGTEPDDEGTTECQSGLVLSTEAFAPTDQLPLPVREHERELVAQAAADGHATIETYWSEGPLPSDAYVRADGAYYRTEVSETATETVPARRLTVSWEKGREPPSGATTFAYDDLPESDQHALAVTVLGPLYEPPRLPTQGLEHADFPAPYPDGVADSTLVDAGDAWVRWNDRAYEVSVGGETTNERHTFEVGVSEVASSDGAFRDHAAERFVVALEDLSNEERDVLEAALEDRYEECEPASSGYESLQERLPSERELPDPSGGKWYVAYDGERFLVEFSSWVV